jgi:hypothetical protein
MCILSQGNPECNLNNNVQLAEQATTAFRRSRPSPTGAPLRFAALTRVSLRGFWFLRLIAGQKWLILPS